MNLSAGDICQLAAEMAEEHGDEARIFARRASREFESAGEHGRAEFWRAMAAFLDDIAAHRIDPDLPITMQ